MNISVAGCSLHSLNKSATKQVSREIFSSCVYFAISKGTKITSLSPRDSLAPAIDPQSKPHFLGRAGQGRPGWSTPQCVSVPARRHVAASPAKQQRRDLILPLCEDTHLEGGDGILTSGFNSNTQKPGNSQLGLKMCADTAALSPAIKPFWLFWHNRLNLSLRVSRDFQPAAWVSLLKSSCWCCSDMFLLTPDEHLTRTECTHSRLC